jgi:threonine dehydratase
MNARPTALEIAEAVPDAEFRISPHVRETPLKVSLKFGELCGADVFFKYENLQHTGSFKVRGALNSLLNLCQEDRHRGVVTASTGNHGAAVAYASGLLGIRPTIFLPESSSAIKIESIRMLGGKICEHGVDVVESELFARHHAEVNGLHYVSPYNDPYVVAGQGTVGSEIYRHLPEADTVVVAVGGGGLMSGIGAYLTNVNPGINMIGCSPSNSPVMIASLREGRLLQLESQETISDGTAGGIEPGSITFDLCRELAPDLETVSEEAIVGALRLFTTHHRMPIEGSAAVAVATLLKRRESLRGRCVVVVLCGGNIQPDDFQAVLA